MNSTLPTLAQLHGMIGLFVSFRGRVFRVIEVLDDVQSLVIEAQDDTTTIQPDAHGYAHRRAREVLTVPALDADGTGMHNDFREIVPL